MMKIFKGSSGLAILILFFVLLILESCEEDFNTIGADIISTGNFNTETAAFDVFASTRSLAAINSGNLSTYQLGRLSSPVFGVTEASIVTQASLAMGNPIFGANRQNQEDEGVAVDDIQENERVTSVFLNLPFFTVNFGNDSDGDGVIDDLDVNPNDPDSDSDEDGVSDSQELLNGTNPLNPDTDGDGISDLTDTENDLGAFPLRFELDSIFGNRDATFDLRVDQSTFFLRDLDPNTNFQEAQEFFSNMDFSPFIGINLFNGQYQISDEEFLIFEEDDPETEEDESLTVDRRIPPGIRVELDPAFFQENLLDREDQDELINNINFREFFRGLIISTSNHSDDLYMIFDLAMATIEVEYDFDAVINGTTGESPDDFEVRSAMFTINLAGNIVNTFTGNSFPPAVTSDINSGTNAERLYLGGSSRTLIELDLFDEEGSTTVLEEVRANGWLINEANLRFFIDRETLEQSGEVIGEPERVYLYNLTDNLLITDYTNELLRQSTTFGIYDGNISRDDTGEGIQYRVRVTEHINNILRNDSTNVKLGLVITSDITNPLNITGINTDTEEIQVPQAAVANPFGTVFFGSSIAVPEDVRLRLEIFYTEPESTENN